MNNKEGDKRRQVKGGVASIVKIERFEREIFSLTTELYDKGFEKGNFSSFIYLFSSGFVSGRCFCFQFLFFFFNLDIENCDFFFLLFMGFVFWEEDFSSRIYSNLIITLLFVGLV